MRPSLLALAQAQLETRRVRPSLLALAQAQLETRRVRPALLALAQAQLETRRVRPALLALIPLLLWGLPTAAADPSAGDLVAEAVASYARAMDTPDRDARLDLFRHAERRFAQVVAMGHENPDLYANLGNAALQTEDLGPAILAYRRALRLDPDHARSLQNLEHARTLLPEWVPRPRTGGLLDTFFFWHRTLSRPDRALAAAAACALAALLLAAGIRQGTGVPGRLAIVPAIAWLALLGSLWLDPVSRAADEAVITSDEVTARAADSAFAPALFAAPLPGGTEVTIVEARPPWLRVRLANGHDVWIPESSATRTSAVEARADPA